jgi:hypothetical protein
MTWLASVKPGDKVAISTGYRSYALGVVDRLTNTQIITGAGTRFRRSDGRKVGSTDWCASYLVEPTPDVVEHVARKRAIARLRAVKWEDLPLSKLGDVLAVIQ